ncbi:MAG: hypothetical protein R3E39_28440 [Anaerolineae bacterium]
MATFQFESLPVALLLWLVVYPIDYYLTLYGQQLWQAYAKTHVEFEGSYELNPVFQKDVDARKKVSRRFLLFYILAALWLVVVFWISSYLDILPAFGAGAGFLILMELVVISGHVQNIRLFSAIKRDPQAVDGHVKYARWVSLDIMAWKFGYWAVIFLILFLLTGSWFLAGGAVSCLNVFIRYYRYSRRMKTRPVQAPAAAST